jgi:tetratricopeptide (TPR) repeat protein
MKACSVLLVAAVLVASCATDSSQHGADYLFKRGVDRMHQQQLDGAIADFDHVLRLDPTHQRAFANRGYTWILKKNPGRALADLEEALRLDPADQLSLVNRGFARMSKGHNGLALADFDRALQMGPENFLARANRGMILRGKGEHDRAIADFDEALRLEPWHPTIFQKRGNSWSDKAMYDKAIADFNRAIALFPEDIENWLYRAESRLRAAEYDKALAYANEAIRRDKRDFRGFYMRGRALHYKREYDKALAEFDTALQLKPMNPGSLWARSETWIDTMEYARAIEGYEAAFRLDAVYAADLNVGWANFFLGRFAASADSFRRRLAKEPGDRYAHLLLYLASRRAGGGDGAVQTLEAHRGADRSWPQPVFRFYLGELSDHQLLEAAAEPSKAKENVCEARFYIGQWHLLRGDFSRGRSFFEACERECPHDFPEYHGALAELKRWPQ